MNVGRYIKLIRNMKASVTELQCTYCGMETVSVGEISICSNCESIIHASRRMLLTRNPDLVKRLDGISKGIKSKDFESAIAIYDEMREGGGEPALLYAEALAYIGYSNYEISKISYDREGFMEENITHRSRGSELISTSKLLLTEAVGLAVREIEKEKGNASLNLEYSLFLAQLKLGLVRGAGYTLSNLRKMTGAYVSEYANLVFDASVGRYDDVIKNAGSMIKSTHISANVFYYIAFALFKKGDMEDSERMLEELGPLMKSENVGSLLQEIEKARGL